MVDGCQAIDGDTDENDDGWPLGEVDGEGLGGDAVAVVGSADGDDQGDRLGCTDGAADGHDDGRPDGQAAGGCLGIADGLGGDSVGLTEGGAVGRADWADPLGSAKAGSSAAMTVDLTIAPLGFQSVAWTAGHLAVPTTLNWVVG